MKEPLPLISPYHPEKSLFKIEGGVVSQGEFISTVTGLARVLPAADYVINLCTDRYHFSLVFCAALVADCVNLLPSNRQAQTITDLVTDYPNTICIFDDDTASDSIPGDVQSCDLREQLAVLDVTSPENLPLMSEDTLAAIAFTSGSTGKPTANKKYFQSLVGSARLLSSRLLVEDGSGTGYSIVATVPSQHMYGLEMTIFMALHGGALVHVKTPFYPQDIVDTLNDTEQRRVLVTTPVHIRALIKSSIKLPETHKVISATAKLSMKLAVEIETAFTQIEEVYGCTEAGSMATRRTTQDPSWTLLDSMSMVDNSNQIIVHGPQLSGPTPISDLLQLLDGHRFVLLGRAQDMINVAGKRASLADLTNKLLSIEGVDDGVVFLPDGRDGKEGRPIAFVVSEKVEHEILKAMSSLIDPVFLPRPLRKVTALKRNGTGKITREILMQQLSSLDELG